MDVAVAVSAVVDIALAAMARPVCSSFSSCGMAALLFGLRLLPQHPDLIGAFREFLFLGAVLRRDSIDHRGSARVSSINCVEMDEIAGGNEWLNASGMETRWFW